MIDKKILTANSNSSCENESGCCTPKPKGKTPCPVCSHEAKGVLKKTLVHLLKEEAKESLGELDGVYFCKTPTCEVIYFKDQTILKQKDVKVIVGVKEGASPAQLCYCFDWSKEKMEEEFRLSGTISALEEIKHKMDTVGCDCERLNPSGGCCLGDVGGAIKEIIANHTKEKND